MRSRAIAALVAATLAAALPLAPASGSAGPSGDPYASRQWGLGRIQAQAAWSTADGTGVLIAIVDTGVDLTHPDLVDKVLSYPDADFVDPKGTCERSTSCIQDGAQDQNGHGTHVAGIAAASTGNGIGVAGTAPGAKILPVRVLDAEGAGETKRLAAGIRYAVDKKAQVINLSLSYRTAETESLTGRLRPVREAISYAVSRGSVVVVAAGNESVPVCAEPSAAEEVLCVGATDQRDLRAYYSNGDATQLRNFLVAPGGAGLTCSNEIFSTYLRGAESACSTENGYEGTSGTSMAAPFVSGVAALLFEEGLSSTEIVDCILKTTDDVGAPGRDPVFGHGRLNAARAVSGC